MTIRVPEPIAVKSNRPEQIFDAAAKLFKQLSTPMPLKIIGCLQGGEQTASCLAGNIDSTRDSLSKHLKSLCTFGILDSRRDGEQILYRLLDGPLIELFRVVSAHAHPGCLPGQRDRRMTIQVCLPDCAKAKKAEAGNAQAEQAKIPTCPASSSKRSST